MPDQLLLWSHASNDTDEVVDMVTEAPVKGDNSSFKTELVNLERFYLPIFIINFYGGFINVEYIQSVSKKVYIKDFLEWA